MLSDGMQHLREEVSEHADLDDVVNYFVITSTDELEHLQRSRGTYRGVSAPTDDSGHTQRSQGIYRRVRAHIEESMHLQRNQCTYR